MSGNDQPKEVQLSQLAQGQEATAAPPAIQIEGPATNSQLAVRRTALPKELEALGVKVAIDPASDMQILVIPKELREKFNVLAPIQAFQQADPNWRPSLRVVELDPSKDGPHFYAQQGNKLAPRKQALELLADAAGIVQRTVQLFGRERVEVGGVVAETFTHIATAKIRKSDGTLSTLQASRTYEPYAEYEEIRDSAAKAPIWENGQRSGKTLGDPGSEQALATEVRKRWLNEIKFAKAKNESKALNRAMRAAIQTSQTYTPAQAAKPFVVVSWNLSPQDSALSMSAIAQLYGATPEALEQGPALTLGWDAPEEVEGGEWEHTNGADAAVEIQDSPAPEREPVESTGEQEQEAAAAPVAAPAPPVSTDAATNPPKVEAAEEPEASAAAAPAPLLAQDGVADTPSAAATQEPGEGAAVSPPAPPPLEPPQKGGPVLTKQQQDDLLKLVDKPDSPVEPPIPGLEPQADPYALTAEEEASLPDALAVKVPSGSPQGRAIGWVLERGVEADEWLSYALRQPWPSDEGFKRALTLALKAHRPEMYRAWREEA